MTAEPDRARDDSEASVVRPPLEATSYSDLMDHWIAEDDGEMASTWAYLRAALEHTRQKLAQQPLFSE